MLFHPMIVKSVNLGGVLRKNSFYRFALFKELLEKKKNTFVHGFELPSPDLQKVQNRCI